MFFIIIYVASLYDNIKEIMEQGITDNNAIKTELTRRFNKNPSNNAISTTKSYVKKSLKMDNSNFNNSNNISSSIPSLSDSKQNQIPDQSEVQQLQNQETQQIPQIENKFSAQLVPSIKANSTLNIEGNTAENQPESLEISKAYQQQSLEETEETKKVYPIKINRIGEITGEMMGLMYETKTMKDLTHGYKPEDSDLKNMSNDVSEILKNRVTGLESEYGDIINVGISTFLLFGKSMFHRFKNPSLKKELIQASDEATAQFEKAQNEAHRLAQQEIEKTQTENKNVVGCNNCTNPLQYKDGLCIECWFKMELKRGNKEMNKAIEK